MVVKLLGGNSSKVLEPTVSLKDDFNSRILAIFKIHKIIFVEK